MRRIAILLTIMLSIQLTGCSIYKMNIRQGNIVEQKDVDQIRKGMNKDQIRFILGRPLVNDSFDENTWYYINTFKDGRSENVIRKELIVRFVNNQVEGLSGDFTLPEGFGDASQS